MHRWIGDPKVTRFLSWGSRTISETEAHLDLILREQTLKERTRYFLAVEEKPSGGSIGDAGFTWISPDKAEIGYFLEPHHWGKGYGREAAQLIIDLAGQLGAEDVVASCFRDNWRSERVMQTCGLEKRVSDNPDIVRYGLKRS